MNDLVKKAILVGIIGGLIVGGAFMFYGLIQENEQCKLDPCCPSPCQETYKCNITTYLGYCYSCGLGWHNNYKGDYVYEWYCGYGLHMNCEDYDTCYNTTCSDILDTLGCR